MLHSILEAYNPWSVYRIVTNGHETKAVHESGAVLHGILAAANRDSDGGIRHVVEVAGLARITSAEVLEDCLERGRLGYFTLEVQ